jgi:WD40 repeat protein
MCGEPAVNRWKDWHELPSVQRWLVLGALALLPVACVAVWYHFYAKSQLVRETFAGAEGIVRGVAFSPDGNLIASASDDGSVLMWKVGSGREQARLKGHQEAVVAVAFARDGKTLASASRDGTVKLWDIVAGKERINLPGMHRAARIAFAPDGKTLAVVGNDNAILLWDIAHNAVRAGGRRHKDRVTGLAYAADGELLASADVKGSIVLWDVGRSKDPGVPKSVARKLGSLVVTPLGPWHAVAALQAKPPLPLFAEIHVSPPEVQSLAFAADNRTLILGTKDGTLMVWDAITGRRQEIWKAHDRELVGLVLAPSRGMFASASAGDLKLWELGDGRVQGRCDFADFSGAITAIAFAPDG